VLSDAQQKHSTIDCSRLVVATGESPDKKLYAKTVDAEGGVHAYDDEQDLKCGELSLKLAPSTRPSTTQPNANPGQLDTSSIVLESMLAHDDVRVTTKDGDNAAASQ